MDVTRTAAGTPAAGLDSMLAPGEVVLWRGKPERRPFVFRTWPLSVFGLVLVTSAAMFIAVVLATEAPDWMAWFAVPFMLAALYMLVGHFLVTRREWDNTEYLVSERQVLIRHGLWQPRITMYSLLGLPQTVVEMRGSDVGNVLFKPREGQGYGPYPGYQTMWPYTPGYVIGLMYVRNPRAVQAIIERARGR
jgi:hypothetical protein